MVHSAMECGNRTYIFSDLPALSCRTVCLVASNPNGTVSHSLSILSFETIIWSVCIGCKECRVSWANMRWQHKTKPNQLFALFSTVAFSLANNNTALHLSLMTYATRIVKNKQTNERTQKKQSENESDAQTAGRGARRRKEIGRQHTALSKCYAMFVLAFGEFVFEHFFGVSSNHHRHHHRRTTFFVHIKYSSPCLHARIDTYTHINTNCHHHHHPLTPIEALSLCQHVHSDSNRSVHFLRLKCIYWFYRWLEPDECSLLVVCIYSLNEWLSLSHTHEHQGMKEKNTHSLRICTHSVYSLVLDTMECVIRNANSSTAVRFYWILNTRFHCALSISPPLSLSLSLFWRFLFRSSHCTVNRPHISIQWSLSNKWRMDAE